MLRFPLLFLTLLFSSTSFSQCPQLIWADEFDKTQLDTNKWGYQLGNGCPDLCGWGNNELEYYTDRAENIKVENGKLIITARKESYKGSGYTSSKIRSFKKGDWTYGRFEARIKMPTGAGLWPAFWMLPTDNFYGGWPKSGEIDISELAGKDPELTYGTLHFGPAWPNNKNKGLTYRIPGVDLSKDFHIYAVDWEQGKIKWFVDNVLINTLTPADLAPEAWPFDKRFHILLNLAVGGWFGGAPDASSSFPQTLEVDYVRVYSNPNTPSITGSTITWEGETETYTANAVGNPAFTWSVPAGSTIVTGQNTNNVTVKLGAPGGKITVDMVNGSCTKSTNYIDVKVLSNACDVPLEDFEINRNLVYGTGTGQFSYNVNNPDKTGLNTSMMVGSYKRNSAQQWDNFGFKTSLIKNVLDYENGVKVLYADIYTDAPAGTKINIQLESSALTPNAYPAGRRNSFVATTTAQNKWQTLKFTFVNVIDKNTPPNQIDRIVFLCDGGNYTAHTYYLDNIRTNTPSCFVSAMEQNVNDQIQFYPNPVRDYLHLKGLDDATRYTLKLFTIQGQEILKTATSRMDLTGLASGEYFLQISVNNKSRNFRVIKE